MDDALVARASNDKRVPVFQPRIRFFDLVAVREDLTEQAVTVQKPVASHGVIQRGGRVEEAGRQPAEPAVAQCCVVFRFENCLHIPAGFRDGLFCLLDEPEVGQAVEQGAALEELRGEVVLLAGGSVSRTGALPIIGDLLHDGAG